MLQLHRFRNKGLFRNQACYRLADSIELMTHPTCLSFLARIGRGSGASTGLEALAS